MEERRKYNKTKGRPGKKFAAVILVLAALRPLAS
jgi:hypothetical protein